MPDPKRELLHPLALPEPPDPKALARAERVRKIFSQPRGTSSPWREQLYEIIFEADTRAGKAFDLGLMAVIVLSVIAVLLESVHHINRDYGQVIKIVEWGVTAIFTVEYILRLACVRKPLKYARSFFGVVDLVSVVPTYLAFFFAGAHALAVVRVLRLLRIFRLLKMPQFVGEAEALITSLALSMRKIVVFLVSVLSLVVIMGAVMYLVEDASSGFDSIPRSIYWAIVTLTTVGYGDIAPQSALGQAISALVMILGYAIIAVPTGIVSADIVASSLKRHASTRSCLECLVQGHDLDAVFCKCCGEKLHAHRTEEHAQIVSTTGEEPEAQDLSQREAARSRGDGE